MCGGFVGIVVFAPAFGVADPPSVFARIAAVATVAGVPPLLTTGY